LKEYVNFSIPKLGIIICLGNVAGQFSPKTFKYFISVLQGILFEMGEKSKELKILDEK
jgi:hypothetical protein